MEATPPNLSSAGNLAGLAGHGSCVLERTDVPDTADRRTHSTADRVHRDEDGAGAHQAAPGAQVSAQRTASTTPDSQSWEWIDSGRLWNNHSAEAVTAQRTAAPTPDSQSGQWIDSGRLWNNHSAQAVNAWLGSFTQAHSGEAARRAASERQAYEGSAMWTFIDRFHERS